MTTSYFDVTISANVAFKIESDIEYSLPNQ